ncbi:hypothetical protein NXC24_PA00145 (plasmid) [Rhizobium sp. NXC24]|nr:hypothetical protein NXC24_PA00145 [Rhizobium sp. NXC24]
MPIAESKAINRVEQRIRIAEACILRRKILVSFMMIKGLLTKSREGTKETLRDLHRLRDLMSATSNGRP